MKKIYLTLIAWVLSFSSVVAFVGCIIARILLIVNQEGSLLHKNIAFSSMEFCAVL